MLVTEDESVQLIGPGKCVSGKSREVGNFSLDYGQLTHVLHNRLYCSKTLFHSTVFFITKSYTSDVPCLKYAPPDELSCLLGHVVVI